MSEEELSLPRCVDCGARIKSDFDPDVGMWYECTECDNRWLVSSANEKRNMNRKNLHANAVIEPFCDKWGWIPDPAMLLDLSERITTALAAAEQQGRDEQRERDAEAAFDHGSCQDGCYCASDISEAIRSNQ